MIILLFQRRARTLASAVATAVAAALLAGTQITAAHTAKTDAQPKKPEVEASTVKLAVAPVQERNSLEKHQNFLVTSVSFSPDGKTLATGSFDDATVKLWDVASGREIKTLSGDTDI